MNNLQENSVSADLVINRVDKEWWSFHDVNSSDVTGCQGLTGPMAIIISEETPPRKFFKDFYISLDALFFFFFFKFFY